MCTFIHTHMCTPTHTQVCTPTHTHVHTYTYTGVHTYTPTHTHMCAHLHMYMYVHTFTCTHTNNQNLPPTHLYFTPAMSSRRLEATACSVSWYLSLRYTTSTIPDWMTSLAHSLQGNKVTYIVQPLTSEEFLFKMALSSAWQTVHVVR